VFDAHERAFAFFKGGCTRCVYDNMKTAVDAIFVGKERQYNRRFAQMCLQPPCRSSRLHAAVKLAQTA
jgi:transposase